MINRRTFLKGSGVSISLPWLESLSRGSSTLTPRRMVFICTPLGLYPEYFFPKKPGPEYEPTPYLQTLKDLREDFSIISGLSHPDVGSSHDSIYSFLTSAPHPERRAGFRNSISIDQLAASRIGGYTRFPSLALSCEGFSLSWTRSGALVPSDSFPSSVFARLFLDGKPEDIKAQVNRLRDGRSILDTVGNQAKNLEPKLGIGDRDKLDEYFTSVRELEKTLAVSEEWSKKPKPKVAVQSPQNNTNSADVSGKARLMFDLMHLAIQTDSTRLITLLLLGTSLVPPIQGVNLGHHDLSHHGQDHSKIAQLKIVELEKMRIFGSFLSKLKETKEGDSNLLDRTCVFFSSNLGNASNHTTKNLPVILAGGGFKHGNHLAFDPVNPPPLSNLYVSMLQKTGIPVEKFGSSNGTLPGLRM